MIYLLLAAFLAQATYVDLFQDGKRFLAEGNIKEAEAALTKSALLNPGHIPTLKALADVYVRLKQFPEAIKQYQHIILINPKDINSRSRMAELYSWVGDYEKSIVAYRDALNIDPHNIGLKTGLARVLRWSQRYHEAEQQYKEVLQTTPNNYEALKGLSKTYAMMGDLADARNTLNRAISIYPDEAELFKEKGTVLAWQEDFHRAVEALQRALKLSPNYAAAHRTLGDVYLWMKRYRNAAESYKKAVANEPNNIDNHILLADAYRIMGKNRLAEEAAKVALRLDPSNTRALDIIRKIRSNEGPSLIETLAHTIELLAFFFIFIIIIFTFKRKKRILRRRHKIYFYFINFILPIFAVFTFVFYFGEKTISRWMDIELFHSISETILILALGISFLALLWTEYKSREFIEKIILAIGAHPDDIELGCGGLIMRAKDSGAKVYGLTLTKGERGTDANGKRKEEIAKAVKYMELNGSWILDFKDTGLKECMHEIKNVIEEKIREVNATMVLTHTPMDIHSDHKAVYEATKEAARDVPSILCYEDVGTPKEFVPNYYVDITGYIDDKMKLVTFHKTQEHKTYMDPEVIKGRAAHRGMQCGVAYAEAFRIYRLLR